MKTPGVTHIGKMSEFMTYDIIAKLPRQKHKRMTEMDGPGRSALAERTVTAHYMPRSRLHTKAPG